MNCLVLMDEEDAEYRSFESLIATNDNFQSSKVMLCIFHAIWQPFKWDVYPLCLRKSKKKGKPMELTKKVVLGVSYVIVLVGMIFARTFFLT
jgi:hypothetical protein